MNDVLYAALIEAGIGEEKAKSAAKGCPGDGVAEAILAKLQRVARDQRHIVWFQIVLLVAQVVHMTLGSGRTPL